MSGSGAERGPSIPLPAATVVLARDRSAGGLEIFLVKRNQRIGFMGGMYVFPGGKLSPADSEPRMQARLIDPGAHAQAWGRDLPREQGAALGVAAIRETFEEAGVLLAEGVTPQLLARRAGLLAGESFADLLESAGLQLRLSALVPLSRWITPAMEPRRYDTCFYVARAPYGQRAAHDESETVDGCWRSPREALDEMERGAMRLSPPTARTLESLLPCDSVDAATALAKSRPPPVIEPIVRPIAGETLILYPGDPEHPVSRQALPGPTRAVFRRR